jgi:DNA-binding beta-propeller fold protein YncE
LFRYDQECQQHLINIITFDTIHSKSNIKINLNISKSVRKSLKENISKLGKVFNEDTKTELIKSSIELTPPNSPKLVKSLGEEVKEEEIDLNEEKTEPNDQENIKFWCPSGVKFNSDKNEIIIADSFNHQIKFISAQDGKLLRCYTNDPNEKEQLNTPRDLCLNSNGDLIVSDSGNNRCCILDKENLKIVSSFGEFGCGKGQFNNPRGICACDRSRIYVCDRNNHRIQVFDKEGAFKKEWGSQGSSNGEFSYPEFICVSKKNHLIVSDTHNHRIQIFDIDSSDDEQIGTFVTSFGGYGKKSGLFRFPRGVTTDAEGFIMVADWKNNRLQLFEPNGSLICEINNKSNKFNNSTVRFDKPVGISLVSNGSLVFTNWGRSQNFHIL